MLQEMQTLPLLPPPREGGLRQEEERQAEHRDKKIGLCFPRLGLLLQKLFNRLKERTALPVAAPTKPLHVPIPPLPSILGMPTCMSAIIAASAAYAIFLVASRPELSAARQSAVSPWRTISWGGSSRRESR